LNTGRILDFRGGVNVSRNFRADLDFSYNHFGLTKPALRQLWAAGWIWRRMVTYLRTGDSHGSGQGDWSIYHRGSWSVPP